MIVYQRSTIWYLLNSYYAVIASSHWQQFKGRLQTRQCERGHWIQKHSFQLPIQKGCQGNYCSNWIAFLFEEGVLILSLTFIFSPDIDPSGYEPKSNTWKDSCSGRGQRLWEEHHNSTAATVLWSRSRRGEYAKFRVLLTKENIWEIGL